MHLYRTKEIEYLKDIILELEEKIEKLEKNPKKIHFNTIINNIETSLNDLQILRDKMEE